MRFRVGPSPYLFCADDEDLDFVAGPLRLIDYLSMTSFKEMHPTTADQAYNYPTEV